MPVNATYRETMRFALTDLIDVGRPPLHVRIKKLLADYLVTYLHTLT